RTVAVELLRHLLTLGAIEEDPTGLGPFIKQTASFCQSFGQRQAPCIEWNLTLLPRSAEGQERLRLLVDVDGVPRLHIDVVFRLVHKGLKGSYGDLLVTLK